MNRRNILNICISAMTVLGLALVPSGAISQQKSLKDQLVGAWTAISYVTQANGTKQQPFGANIKGIIIFDASGRYAAVGERPDRPKFKNPRSANDRGICCRSVGFLRRLWYLVGQRGGQDYHPTN
jgi:hypothetical protein